MATVTFHQTIINFLSPPYGSITGATATSISLSAFGATVTYDGSFQYSGSSLVAGTVTGITAVYQGTPQYAVSGLSLDAVAVMKYLAAGDGLGLRGYVMAGDDVFRGSDSTDSFEGVAGNDTLYGMGQADWLYGRDGDDQLYGGEGLDMLDGGAGLDTAFFAGPMAAYWVTRGANVFVRDSDFSRDGYDTLVGVERLHFTDCTLALDVDGVAGQAYRIYQAAFDRVPDLGGLGYWIGQMDHGMPPVNVAAAFIDSAEFKSAYGALSNQLFATQLYQNILHRAPDAGGLAYWTAELDSVHASRALVLAGFAESPENQAAVIGAIANGITYT